MTHQQFCEVCHLGGDILLCEGCPRAFHLGCLHPPLTSAPDWDWVCAVCEQKEQLPTGVDYSRWVTVHLDQQSGGVNIGYGDDCPLTDQVNSSLVIKISHYYYAKQRTFNMFNKFHYSQTRTKETHWAVRKEFLLSIVSFISCPINIESLSCIKSEERKRFLYPNVSFIRVSFIRVRL